MHSDNQQSLMPSRILYTMIRVGDLDRSVTFYKNALGMTELRRENFSEGRFTLVFIGYGKEATDPVIELTYNWDEDSYELGSAYGHIALQVTDIYATCQRLKDMDVKVTREPGPMTYTADETGHREQIAFIEDPDGYKLELIQVA